jgi:DNA modification methylase
VTPYYDDGQCVIYHGDCRDLSAVMVGDLLLTDPPYGISWDRGVNSARWSKPQNGIQGDSDTSARDWVLDYWLPRPAIVFGSDLAPKPDSARHTLYWQKPNDAGVYGAYLGFRRDVELIFLCGELAKRPPKWSSVLRSSVRSIGNPTSPAGRFQHPHAKPVDLLCRLLDLSPGVVVDPFMGVGSTLAAARHCGRKAIGIEIEEKYCEIAAKRLAQGSLDLFGEATA